MNENNGNSHSERDDFWDIDKLVPKKKTVLNQFATKPHTALYELPEKNDTEGDGAHRRLTPERSVSDSSFVDEESYVPDWNPLIKKVSIKRSNDKYDFYGNFRKAALLYYDYKTNKCDYTPFFSYMPQYSQMSTEQKNYYFYWRSELRRGKYPKTDYSYLYLLVYEILNLPDRIPADEGLKMLCSLWRAYRRELPKLGTNFSFWIQDYCFVHRLACPSEELHDFMFEAISSSSFKEFYLSDFENVGAGGVDSMVAFLSDYDWRRGKFIEESDADTYKKHMLTAMKSLILHLARCGELYGTEADTQVIKRNAFPNSLCTHSVKCRLEIEYISLKEAQKLRSQVTAAVRYTENKIRAHLGVKSRLCVKDLPDGYKRIIDEYFTLVSDKDERIRARQSIPEYEKLYDAPIEKLSFDGADEIERASWETTKRLVVEEEAEEVYKTDEATPKPTADEPESGGDVDTFGLSEEDIALLLRISNGENTDDGLDTEAAVERINEAFSDVMGDVILYHDSEKYNIYDDYTEEIGQWLLKITK